MTVRILHLIASKGFYGAENVVLALAAAQREQGHTPSIAMLRYESQTGNPLLVKAAAQGIPVHDLVCTGRLDLTTFRQLRRLLRDGGFPILHSHNYKSNCFAYFASRGLPLRTIATCHNWTDRTAALRLYGWLDRKLLTRFDHVVTVAAPPAARLRRAGVKTSRISQIANGVPAPQQLSAARGHDENHITFGAVTRLSSEKGVDVLLRATALCLQKGPGLRSRLRIRIAGDGPERNALYSLIAELDLTGIVELTGFLEDVSAFLSSLTVFVQPSRVDAMPMSVLEAMAAGLPIVASALGQLPEMLGGGSRGTLVPAGDAAKLASAMLILATDPERRRTLGAAAHQYVRDHLSADAMARRYQQVYEEHAATESFPLEAPVA